MNKEEKRAYDRAWHANRTPEQKQRKMDLQKARMVKIIAALRDYKALKKCQDCGEGDPLFLDFDHKDRSQKSYNVSDHARIGYSLARILKEVEKCDVVCANCHRRRTAVQLGWN